MSAIRVVNGTYRNKPVRNQEFVLVSGFQTGAKGNYVTVKNDGAFPNCPETIRINPSCITVVPLDRYAPNRTRSASAMRTLVGMT